MPMLRYRSGDIGYMLKSKCACGTAMDVLHLRGRMENMLSLNGSDYPPFLLENFLLEVPEVGMWYHFIYEQGRLTIEVEPNGIGLSDELLAGKVRAHMRDRIGVDCTVLVKRGLPRTFGKAVRILFK
jgi:phenylacetate-CoA ligase